MFYRLLAAIVVVIATCVYFTSQANEVNEEKNEVDDIPINDTIIQFFYNCSCIPYYLCSEANRYSFAARANILPKELYCTDRDFYCCQKAAEPDPTEPSTHLPVSTTTTSTTTTAPTSATTTTTTSATTTTKATTTSTTTTTSSHEEPTSATPITTTTKSVLVRNPFANLQACGVAKTGISLRILTPDTESAPTIPGEVPWIVEIFLKRHNKQKLRCAGSLIHPRVVITATHCVVSVTKKPESLKIVASGLERFQNIGLNPEQERNVLKIVKHPEYNSGRLINDIALLILDKPYNFSNNYLNSICLPKLNEKFDGRRCIAAGWGGNRSVNDLPLNKVDLPVVDSQHCQNLLRKTSLGPEYELHSSLLCAGGEEGKDTCNGDGGGPLMCLGDEYQFVLAGMVSWGVNNKCGIVNQPGLYTNVPKFTDWINKELSKVV